MIPVSAEGIALNLGKHSTIINGIMKKIIVTQFLRHAVVSGVKLPE